MTRVLLASASPRRRALLASCGLKLRALSPRLDESRRAGEKPRAYVLRLARTKALWALPRRRGEELVLGADTAVVLGPRVLGKPRDRKDQERMLRRLSGREHKVLTAVAVLGQAGGRGALVQSQVRFRKLSSVEVRAYVLSGEGWGAAGGYKIQGPLSALLVRSVRGSFSNVVGLPLETTIKLLRQVSGVSS